MTAVPLTLDLISRSINDAGSTRQTLAPLSYRFSPGQFHVIAGPSGAGKTTLLSILSLAIPASSGTIHWGPLDLTALAGPQAAAWRRENLALIFQTSRLVSIMTALENIMIAGAIRATNVAAEGRALLESLGLGEKLHHRPSQLSGGEKQRVAIAQALACRPMLLLADEPTAALDEANAGFVADALRSYARRHSATVICVSHDRAVIEAADQLLTLEKA